MLYTKTMLRACAVSLLALSLLMLGLWSTGNYPPVALANGGGGGTMYTLSKCTPTNGTISNSPTGTIFASGTVVTLTATPSAGYQFAGWSGAVSGMTNPIQLPMNANKSVCASFNKIQRTLTVQIDGGCSGSVTPTVGDHQYDHGTLVAVTASPAEYFDHWSGSGVPSGQESNNSISVPMDANKTVKAHYKPATLTMAVSGGEGAATSPSVGAHTFCQGEYIEISASPTEGFSHWVGDATVPTNRTTTVFMNGPTKSVTAVFDSVTLTMDKSGGVSGASVSPSEGTYTYAKGATVNLSASPSDFFIEWTGGHTGTSASDSFKILENTAVTGVFAAKYLTVTLEGNTGTTDPEPDIPHAYATGDNASISVTPAEAFDHWEGSGVPVGAEETHPLEVEMTVDRAITAVLKPAYTLTTAIAATDCEECTVSPDPDESPHSYPPGSPPVNVAASPTERFDYWEGDVDLEDREDDAIGIIMDASKTATAHFKPDVTLTLAKIGEGTISPDVATYTHIRDTKVTVFASPTDGFDHWEGDLEGALILGTSIEVELTQSKTITAVFKPMYTLTVAKTGGGTVVPGLGNYSHRAGKVISMTATGGTAWIFTGWSGDASGTLPTTSVTMNANKSVTANFIAGVNITVSKQGQGAVSPGSAVYPKNVPVTFTATPASNWRFDHWEGTLAGATPGNPSVTVPMTVSGNLKAIFIEQVTLTMVKELIGNLPADGNTVSPAVGDTKYDKGQVVSLSATQDAGWRFKGWTGGGTSGSTSPINVTMSANKTVTATFIQAHTVTTEVIEQGVIEPEGGTYDHGASQSFFFDRQNGHQFHHWAGLPSSFSTPAWGSGTSTSNPVNVTIEQSLQIIGYDDEIIYTLTADVAAEGCTGCTVDPPVAEYIEGTPGTVTATPGAGWGFVRWEGNVPAEMVEDNPLVMPMNGDKAVTAVFGELHHVGTLVFGQGEVYPASGWFPHGSTQQFGYNTYYANPPFDHWEGLPEEQFPDGPLGPGTSRQNPISITVNRDLSLWAFDKTDMVELQIDTNCEDCEVEPPSGEFPRNSTIDLTALPAEFWHFDYWEGDTWSTPEQVTDNPFTIHMANDRDISAVFTDECYLDLNPPAYAGPPAMSIAGVDAVKGVLTDWFGIESIDWGFEWSVEAGDCVNPDGTRGEAAIKTTSVTFKMSNENVPLNPAVGVSIDVDLVIPSGLEASVTIAAGVLGDLEASISGGIETVTYTCPCLDEEYCESGRTTTNIDATLSLAAKVSLILEGSIGDFSVSLCDITLLEVMFSGGVGGTERYTNCEKESCIEAFINPVMFSMKLEAFGIGCYPIQAQFPSPQEAYKWRLSKCQ